MAVNRKKRRYRFSLFPLFPRFQPPIIKSSPDVSRFKSKEPLKEPRADEGPSCSSSQTPPKRKSWHLRIGKAGKLLFNPVRRLRQSFSKSGAKLSRWVLGCRKGVLRDTFPAPCKSPSDESDRAEFSLEYVKSLLENNSFFTNARTH